MASFTLILEQLLCGENLSRDEASHAMQSIIDGVDSHQIAAFLSLLRAKGETAQEVAGLVHTMQQHAIVPTLSNESIGPLLDIVGTGGDGHHTLNFSTAAAIVACSCNAIVAKHGNRSVSSKCGSADVLEELGIPMLEPDAAGQCLEQAGIAFLFAPKHHPAMKSVASVRKSLGFRTVFNMLGPLLNPMRAKRLMIGVYSPSILLLMADALYQLGAEHALVVHCQGLDELAPLGPAQIFEVTREGVQERTLDPIEEFGMTRCTIEDLRGGTAEENAEALRLLLSGGDQSVGPAADTVILNAGAGLYVCGIASSIREGVEIARESLRSGRASAVLQKWIETSQRLNSS